MSETQATIEFSSAALAGLFMRWLRRSALAEFAEVATDETGYYFDFVNEGKLSIRMRETGRVVDDDDPEMNGEG